MLDQNRAGAPTIGAGTLRHQRTCRHSKPGWDLLRLAKIGMGGAGQSTMVELDDPLIAIHLGALVDRHRQVAFPHQRLLRWTRRKSGNRIGIEARIATQA